MKRKSARVRRADLARVKLVRDEARSFVEFVRLLLDFHGCQEVLDLPEEAYDLLLSRMSVPDERKALLKAHYRGEIELEAEVPKVLDRVQSEFLDSFSGPEQ